jgi:hypothetical protein
MGKINKRKMKLKKMADKMLGEADYKEEIVELHDKKNPVVFLLI